MIDLFQNEKGHKFSSDALLLADFTPLEKVQVFAELGTGSGIISLELLAKQRRQDIQALALDYDKEALKEAKKNALLYKESRITFLEEDLAHIPNVCKEIENYKKRCDLVVTNPPWLLEGQGKMPQNITKRKALFGTKETYTLFFQSARYFLKERGLLSFVSIPERLGSIYSALETQGFILKKLQYVHNTFASKAIFLLGLALFIGKNNTKHIPDTQVLAPKFLREEEQT